MLFAIFTHYEIYQLDHVCQKIENNVGLSEDHNFRIYCKGHHLISNISINLNRYQALSLYRIPDRYS